MLLFFYMVLGVAAGYAVVRLWRTINSGDHKGFMESGLFLSWHCLSYSHYSEFPLMGYLWLSHVYYVFGFLLIVFILVVVCAEVSLVLTHIHICVEDWQWWWRAFFSSGSIAIYIFLYSVNYLVFDRFEWPRFSSPISGLLPFHDFSCYVGNGNCWVLIIFMVRALLILVCQG
ncbi:hypothetical protein AMTRI_Chr08g163700 [Amborella trichopoda]